MSEQGGQEGNASLGIRIRRRLSAGPLVSKYLRRSVLPPVKPRVKKTFSKRGLGRAVGGVGAILLGEVKVLDQIATTETYSGGSLVSPSTPVPVPENTPTVHPVAVPNPEPAPTPTPEPTSTDPRLVKGIPMRLATIFLKVAEEKKVPAKVLSGISRHETGGEFKNDLKQKEFGLGRGIMQIDLGAHPNVSEAQAFDPVFAINYAADLLLDGHKRFDPNDETWDNAIRAYNAGRNFASEKIGYDGETPIKELADSYLAKVKAIINEA